ncbi:MAG: cell division protein ZapE [Betaproteobacteria bacterium]
MSNDTAPPDHCVHRNDLSSPALSDSVLAQCMRGYARAHGFTLDAAQEQALQSFDRLHDELTGQGRRTTGFARLLARRRPVRGIYLWGGVGRGKSFLMDGFFKCLPVARKRRSHFHRFMQEIHQGLTAHQGRAEPLAAIARDVARQVDLVCLDEFHITDITDAMLMRRLLEGMLEQRLVLVTTSNFAPEELYRYGLQRNQFLPAIDLIKKNLEVVHVQGGTDYRLRELERAGVYHVGAGADGRLAAAFEAVGGGEPAGSGELQIEGRTIRVRREARGVAWFDFAELCEGPRAKADYIELARRYHTVLLSGVPKFAAGDTDKLRRFVWLIDEFYDRRVNMIIAAARPAPELIDAAERSDRFQAGLNVSLKERLVSRLTEMQTRNYLAQPHLP